MQDALADPVNVLDSNVLNMEELDFGEYAGAALSDMI